MHTVVFLFLNLFVFHKENLTHSDFLYLLILRLISTNVICALSIIFISACFFCLFCIYSISSISKVKDAVTTKESKQVKHLAEHWPRISLCNYHHPSCWWKKWHSVCRSGLLEIQISIIKKAKKGFLPRHSELRI